jgi:two-component system, response regulator YesN
MERESTHTYLLPHCSVLVRMPSLAEVRERSVYSRRLERLWMFIEEHYSNPDIHLKDAARHSGVSPDHLNLLLHSFAGTTFHGLLSRYRVEKCMVLFHERNYTLTEIYGRCGFSNPTTFNRQFKKWVGCMPREYKRLVRSKRESVKHKIADLDS